MPLNVFLALVTFAFVMAFTPGPNNIMLASSGVNFGFARTIPHMAGVAVGFVVLILACGAGLGLVFAAVPALQLAVKIAGGAYLLWLAWKVATAHASGEAGAAPGRPFTFWQAAAFQWINPKGLVAALSAIAIYLRPGHQVRDLAIMLVVFGLVTVGSVTTWAGFGVALRRILHKPAHARLFNIAMALLLAASIVPMVT
ncbi:MAG TPA: LysE family translocator [Pseudolabrys sp.]|jgi:threonine/homoserine/homoserine lactone efflux protein|nr:LysE family translocator [Pseudolabrys sp.]